jgi:hypothetical protein
MKRRRGNSLTQACAKLLTSERMFDMLMIRSSPGMRLGASVGRNDFHSEEHLVAAVDAAHATVCRGQRELLSLIAEVDRRESWRGSGARDPAHWVSMRHRPAPGGPREASIDRG